MIALKLSSNRAFLIAGLAVWTTWAPSLPSAAQELFTGKTIEVVVAGTAGGGYDQYARTIARHMSKHLPGHPTMVVRDMPGAGGLVAANYLFSAAPKDGSVIGLLARETSVAPLLAPRATTYQFKALEFNWLGSPQQDLGLVLINSKAPAQTLEEAKTKTDAMSAFGPGSLSAIFPMLLNEVLGTKFKIVNGYPGSPEALMAVESGEVDGHASSGSSAAFRSRINPLIERGQIKVLAQLGMQKDPAYAAPLLLDIVSKPSDRQLIELVFTPQYAGRPMAAPPGLPAPVAGALKTAFDATMRDPEFVAEAKSQKLDLNPVTGQQITDVLRRVYAMPPDLIARATALSK